MVFETGADPGTACIRIKGSKAFVDKTRSQVQDNFEVQGTLEQVQLLAETQTYRSLAESQVLSLEEELGQMMTSLWRFTNSFNGSVTT